LPSNLVKTKKDEKLWERAKREARKSYDESDDEFWPTVVKIFKRLKGKKD